MGPFLKTGSPCSEGTAQQRTGCACTALGMWEVPRPCARVSFPSVSGAPLPPGVSLTLEMLWPQSQGVEEP